MCLAINGQIAVVTGEGTERSAVIRSLDGRERSVSLVLTPRASEGDWVTIHSGFAIRVVSDAEARRWQSEVYGLAVRSST